MASELDDERVHLWQNVAPPASLLRLGDEGVSEIDVIIETPFWVWFIEAKYRSDVSTGTTTRPRRDQVLRNIDVGSNYAGVRPFYFSLFLRSPEQSPIGASVVATYSDLARPRELLREHRPDGVTNLRAVTTITWGLLSEALKSAQANASREDEIGYAKRALTWLEGKGISAD